MSKSVIGGYDTFLPTNPPLLKDIDLIIRFGDVPTSKALNTYLDQLRPQFYYHVTDDGVWADDSYRITNTFDIRGWSQASRLLLMSDFDPYASRRAWASDVIALDQQVWTHLGERAKEGEFEGGYIHDLMVLMPSRGVLTVGNSTPVRHLDLWGQPNDREIEVFSNRGASGIDGNISTALGIGAAYSQDPLVLLIGDVTFYHDMNGLLAIQRCGVPIVIVLLNNNGGGIFRTLPVKDYEPSFTEYFITPHTLDFSHVGPLYGLDHHRLTTRAEFRDAFPRAIAAWREGKSTLLEIMTDSNVDVATRREILAEVQEKLKKS